MASPIVLIGTGTSVGKTYVAERILRALGAEGVGAVGYKPIESGVASDVEGSDIWRLRAASTFHVKPSLRSYTFPEPVSPHLAARLAGVPIDLESIRAEIERGAALAPVLLVELPGGAFSPLADGVSCADFAQSIPGARILLVASNRLGVLHDVGAAARACAAIGLSLLGIVFDDAPEADPSTASNPGELGQVTRLPLLARLGRLPPDAPVLDADPARALARRLMH